MSHEAEIDECGGIVDWYGKLSDISVSHGGERED
jgi:hypothetical protein